MSKVDSHPSPASGLNRRGASCHYDINTVAGLIEAMGGADRLTHEFDLACGETRQWEVSGHIPNGWHLRLFAKALQLQRSIAPPVLGFRADSHDWRVLERAAALYGEDCSHAKRLRTRA